MVSLDSALLVGLERFGLEAEGEVRVALGGSVLKKLLTNPAYIHRMAAPASLVLP